MLDAFQPILARSLLGNTVKSYAVAALFFFGVLLLLGVLRRLVLIKRPVGPGHPDYGVDDLLTELLGRISFWEFALVAVYVATRSLELAASLQKIIRIVLVVGLSVRAVLIIQGLVGFVLERSTRDTTSASPHAASSVRSVHAIVRFVIWVGAALFVLDNLGVNITAAVAGLGIGGIAVAMAAKELLGDLFSSFVIFADKPFKVGDFIIVGDMMGVVDHIGIKTTRIRSLSGEMLVFSNSDLTSSRIRNYKQMEKRRVVFGFGVVYQTSHAKLEAIPGMVREIAGRIDKIKLDRAHFKAFAESSLDFEVVYIVDSGDYNLYMDIQQEFNLELKKRFEAEGIEFAYPTRTLYLDGDPVNVR